MIHTFQISKSMDYSTYCKIIASLEQVNYDKNSNKSYLCSYYGLYEQGITIEFKRFALCSRESQYVIDYIINPSRLCGNDSFLALYLHDISIDIPARINNLLLGKSKYLPLADECNLTRCDFTFDVKMNSEKAVKDYIKLLNRAYIPNGFERYMIYSRSSKRAVLSKNDFNTFIKNRINIQIYNKKEAILDHNRRSIKKHRYSTADIEQTKGIVRFEIRLMRHLINGICQKRSISSLNDFLNCSQEICDELFTYYFEKIFGGHRFLTLRDTIDLIESSGFYQKTKCELIDFVKTVNEKEV